MTKRLAIVIAITIIPLNLNFAQSRARDRHLIGVARQLNVSRLDSNLRKQPFERWLKSVVGRGASINWEVDDCGEQDGNPSNPLNRNPPLCANARAKMSNGSELGIAIVVGSHKSGLSGKPVVFYTYYNNNEGVRRNPMKLSELAAVVRKYH